MKTWPRRNNIVATKPYTINYPEFCCMAGDKDFFDNNLVRNIFGAVCKKEISEEDFRDKLAELWGANKEIPICKADWGNGNISYVMTPGDWEIKIPLNWPDYPKYMHNCEYDRCKKYYGPQANNWAGVAGFLGASDAKSFRDTLDTDIDFPKASFVPHEAINEQFGPNFCNYIEESDKVKPYYYIVQPGDTVYTVSRIFLPGARNRWEELRGVNYLDPFSLQEFTGAEGNIIKECFWRAWYAGQELRIPSNWPEPDWNTLFPGQSPPIKTITEGNDSYSDMFGVADANKQIRSGLKWGFVIGGIFTVALLGGTVYLIRNSRS